MSLIILYITQVILISAMFQGDFTRIFKRLERRDVVLAWIFGFTVGTLPVVGIILTWMLTDSARGGLKLYNPWRLEK